MNGTTFDLLMAFSAMTLLTIAAFGFFILIHGKELKDIENGGFDHE